MPIMNQFAEIETCVEVCSVVIVDYCCKGEKENLI